MRSRRVEISETRQVGDLEEASVIDAHKSTHSNRHQLRTLRILWGRSDNQDNQGRHIVWGSRMEEPMEAVLWMAICALTLVVRRPLSGREGVVGR